jgi:pseudouridine kinase
LDYTNSMQKNLSSPRFVAVGATNLDVYGFSFESIVLYQSNPGKIKIKAGGGVRNVVENLLRLGADAHLISAFGNDDLGRWLVSECEKKGIRTQDSLFLDADTSVYMAMMDDNKDLKVGLSDLTIEDYITPEFLKTKHDLLASAQVIQVGSGLPVETLMYLIDRYGDKELMMDVSSIGKIKHMYSQMFRHLSLKMNRIEAQYLCNHVFNTPQSYLKNAQYLIDKGAKRVFITLGREGAFTYDGLEHHHIHAPNVAIKSTSGSGDAFMAGMIFGVLNHYKAKDAATLAMACSSFCLTSESTVSEQLTLAAVEAFINEHF